MKKSLGYGMKEKSVEKTNDKNCPYHSNISIRGKTFQGIVTSDKMDKSVKVEWEIVKKNEKYNRYFKKTSKVIAHNPLSINAKTGDKVLIGETRPISKTKHFVVLKILGDKK